MADVPIRNSKQREAILDIVVNSYDHPTTDMIYARVIKQMPNISMGTVYRNLAQLVACKQVRQISMPSGADRYDRRLCKHSHFICNKCNAIIDIDDNKIAKILNTDVSMQNFEIDSINMVVQGKCPNCKNQNNS